MTTEKKVCPYCSAEFSTRGLAAHIKHKHKDTEKPAVSAPAQSEAPAQAAYVEIKPKEEPVAIKKVSEMVITERERPAEETYKEIPVIKVSQYEEPKNPVQEKATDYKDRLVDIADRVLTNNSEAITQLLQAGTVALITWAASKKELQDKAKEAIDADYTVM